MKRIVMDTNVLYSGLYSCLGASYQILKLLNEGEYKTVISPTLLFEYEDVLKRGSLQLEFTDEQIDLVLDNICALSELQRIYFLWRPFLRDPKDDHVLEVAVASKADAIVTHNTKDFKGMDRFGIPVMSPKQFLGDIS